MSDEKFVVRFFDKYDMLWTDQCSPVSHEEAQKLFNKRTENGTRYTSCNDPSGTYYKIFTANTRMLYSYE